MRHGHHNSVIMIKILGKEEYLKYKALYKEMQQGMDAINYVIDCPWVLDNSKVSSDDVVLEVGCGGGGTGLYMARMCDRLIGVDEVEHPAFKEMCNKYGISNVQFVHTNAKKMPFPDEYFDVAISVSALEHSTLEIANESVKEVCRVLKKGKRFVATVAVSPDGPAYFQSESDIVYAFTKGTGMSLVDTTLTGWKWSDEKIKNMLEEFLSEYQSNQNWLPVGVIVKKI